MRLSWTIMDDLYDLYDSDTNIYQHHSEVSASTTPAQLFMSPDYLSIKLRTSAPLLPSRSRELPHQIFRLGISGTFGFCLGIRLPFACANDQILSVTQSPRDELVCRSASSSS